MNQRFRELVLKIQDQPIEKQSEILNQAIADWQNHPNPFDEGRENEQTDDVLVNGFQRKSAA